MQKAENWISETLFFKREKRYIKNIEKKSFLEENGQILQSPTFRNIEEDKNKKRETL